MSLSTKKVCGSCFLVPHTMFVFFVCKRTRILLLYTPANLQTCLLISALNSFEHFCHFVVDFLCKVLLAHYALVATALFTHSYCTVGLLFLADYEHIWNALHLIVANLTTDLLIAVINLGTHTHAVEILCKLLCILVVFF